jgi:hypothetical protein
VLYVVLLLADLRRTDVGVEQVAGIGRAVPNVRLHPALGDLGLCCHEQVEWWHPHPLGQRLVEA